MGVAEACVHRLGLEHLDGCLALTRAAHWNQNAADWRLMLALGVGWGATLADGTLAASTVALPYGDFAWISMVLVLPEHRRKGLATRLLRAALAELEDRDLAAVLDATPAGREVYLREGFRDGWGLRRYSLRQAPTRSGESRLGVRPIRESDWRWILALDARAFGASREPVLRSLAARLPEAALAVEGRGFILGRDGYEARQLGPLVAADAEAAQALFAAALERVAPPLYVDVVDRAAPFRESLEASGFFLQRPFTRMVRGAERAPGDERLIYLVAGPELG